LTIHNATPIELSPPDLTPYRAGNTGIDHVTTLHSGRDGPHVVVVALTHGNELCGAIAIDRLMRLGVRPIRGRLTFVFANVAAFHAFDATRPFGSRSLDEDMNRVWSEEALAIAGAGEERERARALRPVIDDADVVLDLHSMASPGEPLVLHARAERARALAARLGWPRWAVADDGHPAGRRLIDYTPFADPAGHRIALLVECGQHWRKRTADTAVEVTVRLLLTLGVIDGEWGGLVPERHAEPEALEVTDAVVVRSDRFSFVAPYASLDVVSQAGTVIGHDAGRPIVTPYNECVLVLPAHRCGRGHVAVRLARFTQARREAAD
jgi:predicted deacylase